MMAWNDVRQRVLLSPEEMELGLGIVDLVEDDRPRPERSQVPAFAEDATGHPSRSSADESQGDRARAVGEGVRSILHRGIMATVEMCRRAASRPSPSCEGGGSASTPSFGRCSNHTYSDKAPRTTRNWSS